MDNRSHALIPGMTAACLLVACGLASASPDATARVTEMSADQSSMSSPRAVPVRRGGTVGVVNYRIAQPRAESSKAIVVRADGSPGGAVMLRNQVVVRTTSNVLLRDAVSTIGIPGVALGVALGDDGFTWVVDAPDVASAVAVATELNSESFVTHAMVDSGPWVDRSYAANMKEVIAHQEKIRSLVAPGVAPVGVPGARGGSDPLASQQWYLNNTLFPGRDLNVTPVYNRGLTGAGVTIGIAAFGEGAVQPDHIDYGERFDLSISQPTNPNAGFDDFGTFYAGLAGATAGNELGGRGIAPGVRLASMITGTAIREEQAFAWQNQEIDIKIHPRLPSFFIAPDDGYSPGLANDYVMTALENSLRQGRGKKGTIHIFSTGIDGQFLSPYDPASSGDAWQDIFDSVGEVATGVTNDYTTVPLYPGGLIHNYPPAGHRNTFVIAGVGEDNIADPFSTHGTGVFASVYSSSLNETEFGPGIARGLVSTVSVDGFATNFVDPLNNAPAAITAGIFALMLEANPSLSVRDIQHIIADTAVIDGLGYDFFNTYVSYDPFITSSGFSGTSNWNSNGRFKVHSDQYGFGLIDADAAVEAALNWTSPGQLFALDSGLQTPEEEITIPTATLVDTGDLSATYFTPFTPVRIPFCIRQNFIIESIEVELTIKGAGGGNDLIIALVSPYGTVSNLHYPLSFNPTGTTFDPPFDDSSADTNVFNNVVVGGDAYAFYRHKFVTYKHWDELSGGRWQIEIFDVGPDEQLSEGTEPTDTEPGEDFVTGFGFPLAVPPNPSREEKVVESYRVRIYGTDTGETVFTGCNPGETNCPGDIDGDGVVTPADFNLFLNYWLAGDLLADINGDGILDFADIFLFNSLWVPGPCGRSAFVNGRPSTSPGSAGSVDNPVVRPF